MPGTMVYVSNAESRTLGVFELNPESGALSPVQQYAFDTPGSVAPQAVSPDRRFLYVVQRNPHSVTSFQIDSASGRLNRLGSAPLPDSVPYITVDRTGRWLIAASYQGGMISVSPIGAHGFVQPPHQLLRTEQNPHSIQLDGSNRFAFAPSLGDDVILQWRFDDAIGKLSANTPAFVRVGKGAGPRHFVIHPNARNFYLLAELEAVVYVYNLDPATGTLHEKQTHVALPPGFSGPRFGEKGISRNGGPKAADLHITPDGRFLYASERTTSTLAAFRVDLETGRITNAGSFETEASPRGFAIDPTGRWLLAAGEDSNHLSVSAINQDTGALAQVGRYEMGTSPNWVEVVRL